MDRLTAATDPTILVRSAEIDRICERYKADWRAGRVPPVADVLLTVVDDLRPALETELLAIVEELGSLRLATPLEPALKMLRHDLVEPCLLGAPTLVAAYRRGAGMRPEAGPRGKPAEGSDHGQSGGRTGEVVVRTLLAGCRPPPAGPSSRSNSGRGRFRCSTGDVEFDGQGVYDSLPSRRRCRRPIGRSTSTTNSTGARSCAVPRLSSRRALAGHWSGPATTMSATCGR